MFLRERNKDVVSFTLGSLQELLKKNQEYGRLRRVLLLSCYYPLLSLYPFILLPYLLSLSTVNSGV